MRQTVRRKHTDRGHHRVVCSGCQPSHLFSRGVTRVRNFIVFNFCTRIPLAEQDRIMTKVAGLQKVKKERIAK